MEYIRITRDLPDLKKVVDIYESSFPEEERVSLNELIDGYTDKKSDFFAVYDDGKDLVTIVFIVFDDRMAFIYYLATKEQYRSMGIGGKVLDNICDMYDLPIVLNVEVVDQSFDDFETRKRRYQFYIKHGFEDTKKILSDEQGLFNVLCKGPFDERYYLDFLNSFGGESCIYL